MNLIENLIDWGNAHSLDIQVLNDFVFSIKGVGTFLIVSPKESPDPSVDRDVLFTSDFSLILDENEIDLLNEIQEDENVYYAFKFGNNWYYCDNEDKVQLNPLLYVGEDRVGFKDPWPLLGVHGGYDLCNGSRDYADWCKKAIFCGMKSLGIAEENTLAGVLDFQNVCEKKKIKSIIGETVTVKDIEGNVYTVKLYATNSLGWKHLLNINAAINVFNEKFVTEEELFRKAEGLICVLSPETDLYLKYSKFSKGNFEKLFFQIDPVKWASDERDKSWLLNIQTYFTSFFEKLPCALITDSYYLEKEHATIRKDLNSIGKLGFKNQSRDQFFKTPYEIHQQLKSLFVDDNSFDKVFDQAVCGTKEIDELCDFKIETGNLHLPKYKMTDEEKKLYGTNRDMFISLIDKGLDDRVNWEVKGEDEYLDRLEKEMKVILNANLHDYFLITWDILNWCHNNGILTGYGRGSAAGCLVAYLLGIVNTDPLEYGLMFERFLNEGRLYKYKKVKAVRLYFEDKVVDEAPEGGSEYYKKMDEWDRRLEFEGYKLKHEEIEKKVAGSMPDIDNDIAGGRRDDVKRYIESKYGQNHVASIGTYSALKIKSAISDLGRRIGLNTQESMYWSGAVVEDPNKDMDLTEFFKYAMNVKVVKDNIQKYPELVEKIPLLLGQPKTPSVHAGGVIIVPESENGIYDQMPVKMVDGMLISEWEMGFVEQAGYLKMDILGLKQLDKWSEIIDLVKTQLGTEIDFTKIPLNDQKVFELFGKGLNEDVFQLQGGGLKGYTAELKPESIDDLTATVALYRPGPIETGAHMRYIKRKNGEDIDWDYPFGTEKILNETYGNIVYQEQVMRIVQTLGGFTPNQSDDVRKAMGKKDAVLMATLKSKFVEGAVKNNCPEAEASYLWDQMELFAGYAFNKSHATCYAITGYYCQWLKVHYPLQFWTVSLKYSGDKQIGARLSEIAKTSAIRISPPDINKSGLTYMSDTSNNTIYWTIQSVKQVGEAAVSMILEDREKNGEYFSIDEFSNRMKGKGRAVNKGTIINLILAGAFDEVEGINKISERYKILEKYLNFTKAKIEDDILAMKKWKDYEWALKQKELSGLGDLNFRNILHSTSLSDKVKKYHTISEIVECEREELPETEIVLGGIVTSLVEKKNKYDEPYAYIELNDGQAMVGTIWKEAYLPIKEKLSLNKLIFIPCKASFCGFRKRIVFNTERGSKSQVVIVE